MARIRTIKPQLFLHEGLADLSYETRILFLGLLCQADRAGRLADRPRRLKAQIFPYDDLSAQRIGEMLQELADHPEAFILRYEADGEKVVQITSFLAHQRPTEREPESDLPPPPGWEPRRKERKGADAQAFLVDALAEGPRSAAELYREAEAAGIAERTLRRIRDSIGVNVLRDPADNRGRLWAFDAGQVIPAIGRPSTGQVAAKYRPSQTPTEGNQSDLEDLKYRPKVPAKYRQIPARSLGKGREDNTRYYTDVVSNKREKEIEGPSEDDLVSMFGPRRVGAEVGE